MNLILFKSKILNITFIFFTFFFINFQKVYSDEKFEELNIEYLNKKKSTKYIIGPGDILKINSIQFDLENQDGTTKIQKFESKRVLLGNESVTLTQDNFFVNGDGTINIPNYIFCR